MRRTPSLAASRPPRRRAIVVVLGLIVSLFSLQFAAAETASAADDPPPSLPRWTMLVSNYYDGTPTYGDGRMRCLSTNGATSTSGAGTHSVYLAPCNAATPGQWWRLLSTTEDGANKHYSSLRNLQQWEGVNWCLSANGNMPSGGFSGSHGAYTSKCSSTTEGQQWSTFHLFWLTNTFSFQNKSIYDDEFWELSTSEYMPYDGNVYQVFTVPASTSDTHNWRLYAPTAPPGCATCGL
jgi:hypothetical protein